MSPQSFSISSAAANSPFLVLTGETAVVILESSMHAKRKLVPHRLGLAGHPQTEAGCELIASLILKNGSKKLTTQKHKNNFLSRIKLRISKLSMKLRQNSKKVAIRNCSNDERLINFRKISQRSYGKVSPILSEKKSFSCYEENSENIRSDKTTKGNEDATTKKNRKNKWSRQKLHVEIDEASRLQRRARYLVIKMKLEQNLIDAYSGEGWKGQSREKIKPVKELQRARRQIWNCKLGIRDAIRQLDTLSSVGNIGDSVMAPNGVVHHEHIFCARCRTNEVFPDNDIILCDGTCNCAFHQKCLDPPLETESIPPGDQGWFCKYCECKMEIIDAMNAHLGTQFPLDSHWQDIFKEEAALTNGEVHAIDDEGKWPSDDSEDDDYNPEQRTTGGCTRLADADDSMFQDTKSSTSSCCSLDSEILSASFEAVGNGKCYADSVPIPEEPSVISGPRQRAAVDYKKLYNEMFGKDAHAYEAISDDEDWGPARKRRIQKETDAADILLTLHESNGNFLNNEISQVNKESPHRSNKRPVFRLPPNAVEKLRQVFSENELPSRSVREDLSKDLGIRFEKVNKWFKNARYTALKSRKEHEEPTATKSVPQKESAVDSSLRPKGSKKIIIKGCDKSFAGAVRKLPKRRFSDTQSPQENEANIDFDDNICLNERLKLLLKGKKTEEDMKRVGFATDDGPPRERESELEGLCKMKGRIDHLRQRMHMLEWSECKASDGPTSSKMSIVYVPVAVVQEKETGHPI